MGTRVRRVTNDRAARARLARAVLAKTENGKNCRRSTGEWSGFPVGRSGRPRTTDDDFRRRRAHRDPSEAGVRPVPSVTPDPRAYGAPTRAARRPPASAPIDFDFVRASTCPNCNSIPARRSSLRDRGGEESRPHNVGSAAAQCTRNALLLLLCARP